MTAEQKIIYQSSFPKRIATSKKDTCVYREANYASLQVGIPGTCKYGYSVVNDPDEVNIASELLDKQVLKVSIFSVSKKMPSTKLWSVFPVTLAQAPNYYHVIKLR